MRNVSESWPRADAPGLGPLTDQDRDEAERQDAVFRLRLWTWVVRKHGRTLLPRRRVRPFRYVVTCRRCTRVVTMPTRLGPAEHERMRMHLKLHSRVVAATDAELLRHFFEVKPRR